jgi:hypothetical protein
VHRRSKISLFLWYILAFNDKYANQLKRMLFIPQLVVEVIQITLLVTGTLILLGTVLYGVKQQAEAKKVTVKIIKTMIAT